MPSATARTIVRVLASGLIMAGIGMLVMSSGALDIDPKLGIWCHCESLYSTTPLAVATVFGLCGHHQDFERIEILAERANSISESSRVCRGLSSVAAAYGHAMVEEPVAAIPPIL